jgi:hypothetical protein
MSTLRGGVGARSQMIRSLKGIIDPRAQIGKKVTEESFFQPKGAITSTQLENVLGTETEFLERYSNFQKEYHAAIGNKLNHAKNAKVNVELMKRQGKIDLSVLNKEVSDRLYKSYTNDVLRMGNLIREVGLPAYEMPSANLYSKVFKFAVDNKQGVMHPAQILLNRMMINFNPNKQGLESLGIGRSNIMSQDTVSQLYERSTKFKAGEIFGAKPAAGKKLEILTFDVETTGVTKYSNVRSMSMASMTMDSSGKLSKAETVPGYNAAFKSPQMSGMTVTSLDTQTKNYATRTMHEFLAAAEGTNLGEMGEGGSKYLDETEKFFNRLLQADRVAGHNIGFDIDAMIDTAMKQEAFGTHTGAQKAIDEFTKKRWSDTDYLVDTLESTRSYLQGQVQDLVDLGGAMDLDKRSQSFVNNLFSHEVLARTHIGGSASYGSVENIALNTNLFELIEKDGQAEELFGLITKGSHIAETDVHLQSYVGKYIQEGTLKIRNMAEHEKDVMLTQNSAARVPSELLESEFGKFARAKILQSSAITPTTNIANVQHMSENVFNYISQTPEGKMGVSLSVSREQINQISGANLSGNLTKKGVLEYTTSDAGKGFHFVTGEGKELINQTHAEKVIDNILDAARMETNMTTLKVGNTTRARNLASEAIIDTGISFQRASNADEIKMLSTLVKPVNAANMTTQDVIDTLGTTYRELGTGLSSSDQMRLARGRAPIQSVFQQGFDNYTGQKAVDIAQAFAKVGDPYANILSMDDRVFSTIMANATSGLAHEANRAGAAAGYTAEHIAHSAKSHLTSELGATFYRSQRQVKLLNTLDSGTAIQKTMLPPEIVREALKMMDPDASMKTIGISVAKRDMPGQADIVNAVFDVKSQMSQAEARQLSENILEIMQDKSRVIGLFGGDEAKVDAEILSGVNHVQAVSKTKAGLGAHLDSMTESIMERGIVVGHADERASAEIISNLAQRGIDTSNDQVIGRTAAELTTGHTSESLVVGPYMDRKAVEIGGLSKELEAAEAVVDHNGVKLSRSVVNANRVAEVIGSDSSVNTSIAKNIRRSKSGLEINKMAEFYASHKVKMGYGALGVGAAATGYYMYKKHKERQLYNETLDQQPTERAITTDQMQDSSRAFSQVSSTRRDPLATAGVVGNLDRAKIGHTQMGPNKYNHLFGG